MKGSHWCISCCKACVDVIIIFDILLYVFPQLSEVLSEVYESSFHFYYLCFFAFVYYLSLHVSICLSLYFVWSYRVELVRSVESGVQASKKLGVGIICTHFFRNYFLFICVFQVQTRRSGWRVGLFPFQYHTCIQRQMHHSLKLMITCLKFLKIPISIFRLQ